MIRPRVFAPLAALAVLVLLSGCQTTAPAGPAMPVPADPAVVEPNDTVPPVVDTPRPRTARRAELPSPPQYTVAAEEVLDQLRGQLEEPGCSEGALVAQWRRRYAGSPARFSAEIERSLPLMAFVLEEVKQRGLPGEFALIPIVESWYQTDARARGGPAGMWQMIPSTARGNGIVINAGYDGRFSALDSTQAALDHLDELQQRFGDWRLAAMAYNAGEYRLARAVGSHGAELVASGERRQPNGLAAGTYEYIGKIKALSCLLSEPERFRVELPAQLEVPRLTAIDLGDYRGPIARLAERLDTDTETLETFNRGYQGARVGAQGPATLLVPAEVADRAPDTSELAAMASAAPAPGPAAAPISGERRYRVRRGDTLSAIAARHGLSLRRLLGLNGLDERAIIRPGQLLRLAP